MFVSFCVLVGRIDPRWSTLDRFPFGRSYFISCDSWDSVDTVLCVEYTRALLSGAPKLVWRRNNDPNTRRLFDSSELRDVNEPVLLEDDAWFGIYMCLFCFWFVCLKGFVFLEDFVCVCLCLYWQNTCLVCIFCVQSRLNENQVIFPFST